MTRLRALLAFALVLFWAAVALARPTVAQDGLKNAALRPAFLKQHVPSYGCEIPMEKLPHAARNQRGSGRCWIFATEHVLESKIRQRGSREKLHLSRSFINYHSLRERCRQQLLAAATHDGPLSSDLRDASLSEGGWFPLAAELVRRYGVVPDRAMPSTKDADASHSSYGVVMTELSRVLASAYRDLDALSTDGRSERQIKHDRVAVARDYAARVDKLLASTLGRPPKTFTYGGKEYTPRSFAREHLKLTDEDLSFVTLSHDPRRGWNRKVTRDLDSHLSGFKLVEYNVPMSVIEDAVRATLDSGQAVAFGTNVGLGNKHRADKKAPPGGSGILSLSAYDYGRLIPQAGLDKRARIRSRITPTNHEMTFTGYDPSADGKSVRKWKVDNSWGPDADDHGHLHMYDDYFRQYVTDVSVPRSALPAALLEQMDRQAAAKQNRPWTVARKQAVVLSVMRGDETVKEAAKRVRLAPAVVQQWHDAALRELSHSLAAAPAPPRKPATPPTPEPPPGF
jgi:bleomycin hydrolase